MANTREVDIDGPPAEVQAAYCALMLLIPCPHCGPRDETEFSYGGQAGIAYPKDPDALTDAEWVEYLFLRDNPKGPWRERWVHTAGCRRWFDITRDTLTNVFQNNGR